MGKVGEARWTYAVSKLAEEHLAISYHKEQNLPAVVVRPFNIYGPGQIGEGAIHHFVVRAITGKPLMIHGEGDQIRSWCYIDDMLDGILILFRKGRSHRGDIHYWKLKERSPSWDYRKGHSLTILLLLSSMSQNYELRLYQYREGVRIPGF
jgi:nucleoside-diphosphate-sugar epimerase